jgi:hypothetical protein
LPTEFDVKIIPEGYLPHDKSTIKLDWSDELKKINNSLLPETQTIYRIGGLTFFDQYSAAKHLTAINRVVNGPPAYEIQSKTEFHL